MTELPHYETLKPILLNEYRSDSLQRIFHLFIKQFIRNERDRIAALPNGEGIAKLAHKYTKESGANAYAFILSDKQLFLDFLRTLPNEVVILFNYLAFARNATDRVIEKTFKIKTITKTKPYQYSTYTNVEVDPIFQFFNPEELGGWGSKHYEFSLPLAVCEVLADYIDKPADYYLKPSETLDNTTCKYENNEDIIEELQFLTAYYHQNNIKTTATDAVTMSTANKMRKKLKIKEFYPETDKNFEAVRSFLIAGFISSNSKKTDLGLLALEKLKGWIKQFASGEFYSLKHLFAYVKGLGYVSDKSKSVSEAFCKYVKSMEVGRWYDYDKVYVASLYRNFTFEVFSRHDASRYLHYNVEEDGIFHYTCKEYLDFDIYDQAIVQQTLKGLFFLFASFGIFDIAFNHPDTTKLSKTYFSPFDGLRYVRLTPLGAYVFGITRDFQAQKTETVATFVLDAENLFIHASDSPQCEAILQDIAIKVSANRYKVTALSFLKSCKKDDDVHAKIQYFKNYVCNTPPQNWNDFLNSLERKINPLIAVENQMVFQIPSTDTQLIALLAKDEILRDLVTKAENYQIIITKRDYAVLVNRLKEFGYFIA